MIMDTEKDGEKDRSRPQADTESVSFGCQRLLYNLHLILKYSLPLLPSVCPFIFALYTSTRTSYKNTLNFIVLSANDEFQQYHNEECQCIYLLYITDAITIYLLNHNPVK